MFSFSPRESEIEVLEALGGLRGTNNRENYARLQESGN